MYILVKLQIGKNKKGNKTINSKGKDKRSQIRSIGTFYIVFSLWAYSILILVESLVQRAFILCDLA